jgi:hypothetical protein
MWLFRKRKHTSRQPEKERPCPFCGGLETRVDNSSAAEGVSPVKAWRGERLTSMKCLSCGKVFYAQSADNDAVASDADDGRIVDDEEALRAAEEELKRQTDAEDDRRYRGG